MDAATKQHVATLEPACAVRAYIMVMVLRHWGFPAIITSSRRSTEEQARLVQAGVSWTMHSKHLDGLAFDIDWQGKSRDDVAPWWWTVVEWLANYLDMETGASYQDYGHIEMR